MPARQLEILQAMDLPNLLGIRPATVFTHTDPPLRTPVGTPVMRQAASTVACYSELIIRHLTFSRMPMASSALHAIIQFRDFDSTTLPARSFTTFVDAPLTGLTTPAQTESAIADAGLDDALRADVRAFAKAFRTPQKRR